MTRQPTLDTGPIHCHYAARPTQRPHCQLTAVLRYGTIALCANCDARRSTLGKAEHPHPLPAQQPLDVLDWITQAHEQTHQAHTQLAAAVSRARTHGHSWTTIGTTLNITRQAAQQRFKQDHPAGG